MSESVQPSSATTAVQPRLEEAPPIALSLLLLDQRRRWQKGDRVLPETYLKEYPSPHGEADRLLELLYHEVVLREERGESPNLEEYQRRFPEHAEAIRLQFEVHAALRSPGDPKPDVSPAASTLPSVRGYEVLEILGRGGMGVVYKARQIALNRLVALKMVAGGDQTGLEERHRFRTEAEAIACLQHPHIVQIYEVGVQDDCLFLSLEYVDGGTLADYLDGTPWPAAHAIRLVEPLARAMHHAHQRGIVHRDLKPANILLASGGVVSGEWSKSPTADHSPLTTRHSPLTPKIADFGLAKLLQEDPGGPTQTGDVLGTPSYMSPEQVEAGGSRSDSGRSISPVTDVYGLGALLYELLTGRPPFRGETPLATCRQILSTEPVSPSRLQPACPRDAETICLKCLQKEPRKRYASAEALADDLQRFLEGRPIAARPITAWGRAVKWARRRPGVATLLAGIVAVTLLGFAGTSWQWREAETRRMEAETRSYFDRIARAYQEWSAHNVARANELLEECRSETPQLCRWEWDLLKRRCNEHLLALEGHTLDVRCVTFSPDGRLLASCSGEWNGTQPGEVLVWDAASGERLHSFSGHRSTVSWVAFEPNGRRLASAGQDGVVLLRDLDNAPAKPTERNLGEPVFCVAFSPKGERLAAACADGWVRVIDLATGRLLQEWHLHKHPVLRNVFSVAYSRDGRYLASAGRDGWVCLVETESGKVVRRFPHGGDTRRVAFSPDGRWLASGAFDGTIKLLDLTRNEAEPVLYHLRGGIFQDLAFSPDGLQLACSTRMGGVVILSTESGRHQLTLREDLGVLSVAFRPDGQRLATAGENLRVKVWDLTAPVEPRLFDGHQGAIYSLAISPDQRPEQQRLALAGAYNTGFSRPANTLRLFDLAQAQFLREFPGHTDSLTSVAFRPDGRQVATASVDRTARLWDLRTGKQEAALKHDGAVTGLAYSSEGKSLATSCDDGQLRLWDVADGRLLHSFSGHVEGINGVAFAPCGRYLVSAGRDHTVRVWDVATGRTLGDYRQHGAAVGTVVFNRDGTQLASADVGQTVWLWHVSAGGELAPARAPIRLGLPASAKEIAVLGGSRRGSTSLAFSPDGQRLASVSPDRPVQLWDVATGREVLTLAETPYKPVCVAFSPDGRRLVLSTAEGQVAVWDAEFLSPKARAQAAAERTLDWLWRQTKSADSDKAQFAVILHASQGIAAQPQEVEWYNYRAWAHADLGQWDAARADYARAVHLKPGESWLWYRHAIACLGAGDRVAHHDACARMLEHFADKSEAALDCAYACAIDPKAGGNAAQLVALCQTAAVREQDDLTKPGLDKPAVEAARRSYGVALRAHGAALYRAGQYKEAVATLEKASAYFPPRAWDRLFLAMAHQHLGEDAHARDEFDKAVKAIAAAGQARAKDSGWLAWYEQVEVQALCREAEALVGGPR